MLAKIRDFNSTGELKNYLLKSGNTPKGSEILSLKGETLFIEIEGIDTRAANILKQDAISVRGDCAVPRKASMFEKGRCKVLLIVNRRDLDRLVERLREQPFGLKAVADEIERLLKNIKKREFSIAFRGKKLALKKPKIMGILNVTPDSFSDGGLYTSVEKAVKRCEELLEEGAEIVDIGGESTRPGSEPVPLEEELKRVVPVIEAIRKHFGDNFFISIDTYKYEVAKAALDAGADMINDISGLQFDRRMEQLVKETRCPAVINHIKGTPKDMQKNPYYEDVVNEIFLYFKKRIESLTKIGINEEQLILDPGIGFGKRVEDNLCLIKRLREFTSFGRPILIGTSRKSFIGTITGEKTPSKRLAGSLATVGISVNNGAKILRVHDVKETKQFLDMHLAVTEATC